MLLDLKEREKQNKKLFGKEYHACDYILKWDDGRPFSPDYVTQKFPKLLEENDLPRIRFHDLRHTCATLLLSNGVSMYQVQEYLRHADISTTINTYGHLDIRDRTNTGNRLCEILETDT